MTYSVLSHGQSRAVVSAITSESVTPDIASAADRLRIAATMRVPCAPIRDLVDSDDLDAAYAVQSLVNQRAVRDGARVVGRKIGLTSEAVQNQLGVERPDFGVLFSHMARENGSTIDYDDLLQPRIEAEIAFVLADDLAEGELDAAQVKAAIAYACPALEICDSRIAGWNIAFADTVADNASSGLYVLGPTRLSMADFAPVEATMSMTADGVVISEGSGRACLGDPLNALSWLARTARHFGAPLQAGQLVLSGALGPLVPVEPGQTLRAEIGGLGDVTATFTTPGSGHPA